MCPASVTRASGRDRRSATSRSTSGTAEAGSFALDPGNKIALTLGSGPDGVGVGVGDAVGRGVPFVADGVGVGVAVGFALSLAVWVGLLVLTRHSLWREIMQRRAAVPA